MKFLPPIPLKQFCHEQAEKNRVTPSAVYEAVRRGKYRLRLKRKNARIVLVCSADLKSDFQTVALPGELPLKEFVRREAARAGKSIGCIYMRLYRGKYGSDLKFRRLNARVVFVKGIEA